MPWIQFRSIRLPKFKLIENARSPPALSRLQKSLVQGFEEGIQGEAFGSVCLLPQFFVRAPRSGFVKRQRSGSARCTAWQQDKTLGSPFSQRWGPRISFEGGGTGRREESRACSAAKRSGRDSAALAQFC